MVGTDFTESKCSEEIVDEIKFKSLISGRMYLTFKD